MNILARRLFLRDRARIEREVEEQLRFHLELLTTEYLERELSFAEATDAALKRFGNVEEIKDQCVEINSRNRPLVRALKVLLVFVFLLGVWVRIVGAEFHVTRMGDVLMMVGAIGRLLLYVRGLHPSIFRAKPGDLSLLVLNDKSCTPTAAYDSRKLTPVERIISDQESSKTTGQ